MFDLTLWLQSLAFLAAFAVAGWLVSLPIRNVSIVDTMWSLMFLLAAGVYVSGQESLAPRAVVTLAMVAAWALRLASYISWRNRGHGEDFRYQRIRARNEPGFAIKSLYLVFGLQAALAWVISLPLLAAVNSNAAITLLDWAGGLLWAVGMVFEVVGDAQLARFKGDAGNRGKVMDRGLWRYTRHPNYFGDFCVWWGFFLLALAGGGWWSVVGPALMTVLLLKVSGVALLEKDIGKRRPGYRDYIRRTNAFFPGPPRAAGGTGS
jgi:steroid 5-alpha reductase family enzyme